MKKRVLLTGASGFIGSNLLEYLLQKTDWKFVCICSWEHRGNPLNLQFTVGNNRVRIIHHDLTKPIPEIGHFDYIFNLASESHVDRSIQIPVPFVENNVSSVLRMLEYAREHKPEKFIQFSTDEVFGTTNHAENDVLMPSNPYAASKACQEMIAISYLRTYHVPIVITNSNNIVGKNQDPEKFVPKIIKLIKNDETVSIHTVNGKAGTRFYNPVENVAEAVMFIVNNIGENKILNAELKPLRFNLPGGKELDNLQMAQLVAKKLNTKLKYELVDAESVRPGYDEFYPEAGNRLLELGFIPPYTLEQGLSWIK